MMSDDEGFFERWSRRKTQRRAGEALSPDSARDAPRAPDAVPVAAPITPPNNVAPSAAVPPAAREADGGASAANALPLPSLADVAKLTPSSDFSRFVAAGVDPSVQHAALKTLFSDPHFNEMDGLDVYIDDYNKPNPIPAAMRRRLEEHAAQRARQSLEADGEVRAARAEPESITASAVSPDGAPAPALPQSAPPQTLATLRPETDEDTALRLQPDDAADAAGAGAHRPGPRA